MDPSCSLTLQPSPRSLLRAWSQAGAQGYLGEAKQNMLLSLTIFFLSFYYFKKRKRPSVVMEKYQPQAQQILLTEV